MGQKKGGGAPKRGGGGGRWGSLALNENYGRRDLTVPFKLV